MRKPGVVLLVVLGMACIASPQTATSAAAGADSSVNSTIVVAGLNALPSSPIVSPATGALFTMSAASSIASSGALVPIIAVAPGTIVPAAPVPEIPAKHPFLDKSNLAIFASLVAARTMDPISTWQFRRHGLPESQLSDAFVDNKALFVTYSASLVAAQISTSYVFHRLGWHKAERISAMIHTAAVTEAVVHNYRIGSSH
jgi:hypothetical protein